nr:MAG TPA: Baseplate J like protein [Caudoviricetes sp.]
MIGEHLDNYSFQELLNKGLAQVSDSFDKREGSPIYDAAASMAVVAMKIIEEMKEIYIDTFAKTATGEELTLRCTEAGVHRKKATYAIRKAEFISEDNMPYKLPIGARFSTTGEDIVIFSVMREESPGVYELKSEAEGEEGNLITSELLPVEVRTGLKKATLTDIIIPGEDEEDDESLRARYFEEKNAKKFGGNIEQYKELMLMQDGVGACQIYPVWQGGGTVKISFIDSTFNVANSALVEKIQALIDPTKDGQGIGLAPIDHIVTVGTATAKNVNISARLQLASGYSISQLTPFIKKELESYFETVRKGWGKQVSTDKNEYRANIFRSQIIASILRVQGVLDVSELKLNGANSDIITTQTATLQELPTMGVVSLE